MNFIGSIIFFFIFILIFIVLMIRYVKSVRSFDASSNILIYILRSLVIIFLLLLILDIRLNWISDDQRVLDFAVLFDNSKSSQLNFLNKKLSINKIKNSIDDWGQLKNINIDYYAFSDKIYFLDDWIYDEIDFFYTNTTNFTKIKEFDQFKNYDNILLISDGQVTGGKRINELDFSSFPPFYSIGIGEDQKGVDLSVDSVELLENSDGLDSIIVKIKIKSNLYFDEKSTLNIINSDDKTIYNKIIRFEKGVNIRDEYISINLKDLTYYNFVDVGLLNREVSQLNNKMPFLYNNYNNTKQILLLTGALSSNTSIIKKSLNSRSNFKVHDYYKMASEYWNDDPNNFDFSSFDLILLDDFPINNFDKLLFEKIYNVSKNKKIPLVIIQGPGMDLKSTELISRFNGNFTAVSSDVDELSSFDLNSSWLVRRGYDFSSVPPQRNSLKWNFSKMKAIKFTDDSFMLARDDNFYILAMPELSYLYYNQLIDGEKIVKQILEDLFFTAFNNENNLLKLSLNNNIIRIGEYISSELIVPDNYLFENFIFFTIKGQDTLVVDCNMKKNNNKIIFSHNFEDPGEYKVFAAGMLKDGTRLFSNKKNILVLNVDNESEKTALNKEGLSLLSSSTNGYYAPFNLLDSLLLAINTDFKTIKTSHVLSGITFQKFWWIIIILLCLEWFIRKQKGYL